MEYNFAIPLGITGDELSVRKISERLQNELGYIWSSAEKNDFDTYKTLVTDYEGRGLAFWYNRTGRDSLSASNEDLIMALAAQRQNGEFQEREILYWIEDDSRLGKLAVVVKKMNRDGFLDIKWLNAGAGSTFYPKRFRRATKDEIIAHFGKTSTEEKKLQGYKAPFDLFGGEVPTGSLFVLIKNVQGVKEGMWYANGASAKTTAYSRHLPKEIVETWEPCYEDILQAGEWVIAKRAVGPFSEAFQVGKVENGYVYKVDSELNTIRENLRRATHEEIQAASTVKIGEYTMETTMQGIKFGCQAFTRQEIDSVEALLKRGTMISLKIDGNAITLALIEKIKRIIK